MCVLITHNRTAKKIVSTLVMSLFTVHFDCIYNENIDECSNCTSNKEFNVVYFVFGPVYISYKYTSWSCNLKPVDRQTGFRQKLRKLKGCRHRLTLRSKIELKSMTKCVVCACAMCIYENVVCRLYFSSSVTEGAPNTLYVSNVPW